MESGINQTTLLWILGGMQAVTWLLIGWLKMDIKSLWKRADGHGHVIRCDNRDCEAKTDAVIIHESRG